MQIYPQVKAITIRTKAHSLLKQPQAVRFRQRKSVEMLFVRQSLFLNDDVGQLNGLAVINDDRN